MLLTASFAFGPVAQAMSSALPLRCESAFHPSKTAALLEAGYHSLSPAPKPELGKNELDLDSYRLERDIKIVEMSDADFNEMVDAPSESDSTIASYVKTFGSFEAAAKALFIEPEFLNSPENPWTETGEVDYAKLPRTSLSLENGRQNLQFVRIQFSDRDASVASAVLQDYIAAATRFKDLRILVTVANRKAELETILKQAPLDVQKRIKVVPLEREMWIWAQDGSKPIDLPNSSLELNGSRYVDANDQLSKASDVEFKKDLPFYLQGGNIVVGDRHVLIGTTEFRSAKTYYRAGKLEVLQILSRIFQKEVKVVEVRTSKIGGDQWSFHIDLDLVLALDHNSGIETALVRSPSAFLEAFSGQHISKVPSTEELQQVRKLILDRYARGEFGLTLASGSQSFLKAFAQTSAAELRASIIKERLLKRLLKKYGYPLRDLPSFGEAQKTRTQDVFFGTNAVLSGKMALIPGNKMPELDSILQKAYRDLGYEVMSMPSSSKSICLDGGIRCVTETYRKPFVTLPKSTR